MKNFLISHAFSLVAGPLVATLVYFCHEGLQKAWGWLDRQDALVKRVGAFILAAILTPLASSLGVAVPEACSTATLDAVACLQGLASSGWLTAAIGGALSLVLHAILKPKSVPPTT